MRKTDAAKTHKRKSKILHAAVHHYIKTGAPASSKILVGDYGIDCSSATVRNILAALEEEGYLAQLHTSSGRVPTDKGYRAYVDMLEGSRRVALDEAAKLRKTYGEKVSELEEVIVNTSRVLTTMSHYSGFVSLPAKERTRIKDVELISVPGGKTLFVFVTNTGMVRHRLFGFEISRPAAGYVNAYLRERLAGVTLDDAQSSMADMQSNLADAPSELENMGRLLATAFDYTENLHIEGVANIMALPEFKDLNITEFIGGGSSDSRRNLGALARVIRDNIASDDVKVIIGAETRCKGFECVSAVIRSYRQDDRPVGMLGILGPKRMEYSRMMSIVESVSKMLEKALEKI